jgi:hypothetical protein
MSIPGNQLLTMLATVLMDPKLLQSALSGGGVNPTAQRLLVAYSTQRAAYHLNRLAGYIPHCTVSELERLGANFEVASTMILNTISIIITRDNLMNSVIRSKTHNETRYWITRRLHHELRQLICFVNLHKGKVHAPTMKKEEEGKHR